MATGRILEVISDSSVWAESVFQFFKRVKQNKNNNSNRPAGLEIYSTGK
jgi:hypothetical protein